MTARTSTGNPATTTVAGPSRAPADLLNNPYGLTLHEARAEIRRLSARGWQIWELRLRFANNRKDDIE
jgi:hypothetical protein